MPEHIVATRSGRPRSFLAKSTILGHRLTMSLNIKEISLMGGRFEVCGVSLVFEASRFVVAGRVFVEVDLSRFVTCIESSSSDKPERALDASI